ncbi:hypothetical protein PAP_01030 [Palaeococcus pacificus DY20341]|uniref:Uncharacterized protein n=1 Tax=Palaeococcus pacificus DY20341 TaxID=1343739 RepID=A0A075LW27_9EURY|nr:hypothetical protein [Palaeococcus pacificus]AIF68648.1 hypothetical protein PAP_01030 [Palaeococcus pacificus DY20341]
MVITGIMSYLASCFILLIPIFLWNVIFASKLPEPYQRSNFWSNIPKFIGIPEKTLRVIVFFLPLLFKLELNEPQQKIGFLLYVLGICVYFMSWLMQIYFPESSWSQSVFGFMAPAYTTIIWFVGIGLIGKSLFIKIPYHYSIYIILSVFFVVFHSIHSFIVYSRFRVERM